MQTNDILLSTRITHIRELQAALDATRHQLDETRRHLTELESHFAEALLAVHDAEQLHVDARIILLDGWNILLGARKGECVRYIKTPEELISHVRKQAILKDAPFHWLIFDGPKERSIVETGLRVSYTGGIGAHRADRLILDYLRMRLRMGCAGASYVISDDKDFTREAKRLGAGIITPADFLNNKIPESCGHHPPPKA